MTLHSSENETEVGVRELHDKLSEHLGRVEDGESIVVTRRGKPIARLIGVEEGEEPLADLVRRGLVRMPTTPRTARRASIQASGSVSDLVRDQRR